MRYSGGYDTSAFSVLFLDEFVCNQILRNVALHQCLTNGCSAVNGCRQNESPNS